MQRCIRAIIALAPLTVLLTACGGGGDNSAESSNTGIFTLGITDAPVDTASRVLVQFSGVSLQPDTGAALDLDLSGDSQTCQDLLDDTPPSPTASGEPTVRCIELLELEGTQTATLLEGIEMPAGNYSNLRLTVDAERGVQDSLLVLDDGSQHSLFIPSGSQSGLKFNQTLTILAGGSSNFVIDFDLRKSLTDPQGSDDYTLRPALRLIDRSESGSISGTVAPELLIADNCTGDVNTGNGFAVYAYDNPAENTILGEEGSDDAPLSSAAVRLNNAGEWSYTLGFLPPGDYAVGFTCEAADDAPDVANDGISVVAYDDVVTVTNGQDSEANFE